MNTESGSVGPDMPGQIDRLVCGELDESARQELLAWLEADFVRWRICGVAFLEAQAWSRAMEHGPRTDQHSGAPTSAIETIARSRSPARLRAPFRQATTAAAVLVAFGLGLAGRDFVAPSQRSAETGIVSRGAPDAAHPEQQAAQSILPSKNASVMASVNVETPGGFGRSMPIQIPVVPAATDESRQHKHAVISDYERQKWERRGFKVSLDRRYVFAKLPDGQQVVVPIDQLRVNPVPVHIN